MTNSTRGTHMSNHSTTESIASALGSHLGGRWVVRALNASGFCSTWRAQGAANLVFVKSVAAAQAAVLMAEADGLAALASTRTIRVPKVIDCWPTESGDTLLALEWLDFRTPTSGHGERLGHALAALHAKPSPVPERFGWHRDNMIGGTPQINPWSDGDGLEGWLQFFRRARLGAMRERLLRARAPASLITDLDAVDARLPTLFDDGYRPRASLIHGDLWSGNWAMLADGTAVIYDPAVSYSDAEAEIAMMELFGAPPAGFWPAYRESFGVAPGYERRRGLYQLYHLLNHVLLFGGGYLRQAQSAARALR